jgi:DNA-directed RNA polymerase beta subunit
MVSKTRQPPQGKSNKGGMKIGNMETDAIISHGMFSFIKESFMERSDNYYVFVCKHTGKISEYNADIGYFNSPDKTSRNNTSHVRVNIPYSFK